MAVFKLGSLFKLFKLQSSLLLSPSQTVLGDLGLAVGLLALASFIMVTVGGALYTAGAAVLLNANVKALHGRSDPSHSTAAGLTPLTSW